MCIIVDANSAHELTKKSDDGMPVLKWMLSGKGGLIIGGELKKELSRSGLQSTMVVLDQAGRLKKLDDAAVDAKMKEIASSGHCCSNDMHVIAVAAVSGCRLLYSKDQALHTDAKNPKILSPRASIYQTKAHQHLLTECDCG